MALFLLCPNLGWIQGQFNFTELSLRYRFRINIKMKDSEVRLQKLAKLLTQRSYTQKELTDLLKVSDQTVRNDISKLRAGGFTIEEEGGHQGSPKTYTLTKTPDGWKADDEDSGE